MGELDINQLISTAYERDIRNATETEDGEKRVRRLFGLGYI